MSTTALCMGERAGVVTNKWWPNIATKTMVVEIVVQNMRCAHNVMLREKKGELQNNMCCMIWAL